MIVKVGRYLGIPYETQGRDAVRYLPRDLLVYLVDTLTCSMSHNDL